MPGCPASSARPLHPQPGDDPSRGQRRRRRSSRASTRRPWARSPTCPRTSCPAASARLPRAARAHPPRGAPAPLRGAATTSPQAGRTDAPIRDAEGGHPHRQATKPPSGAAGIILGRELAVAPARRGGRPVNVVSPLGGELGPTGPSRRAAPSAWPASSTRACTSTTRSSSTSASRGADVLRLRAPPASSSRSTDVDDARRIAARWSRSSRATPTAPATGAR